MFRFERELPLICWYPVLSAIFFLKFCKFSKSGQRILLFEIPAAQYSQAQAIRLLHVGHNDESIKFYFKTSQNLTVFKNGKSPTVSR